ncbi:C69 family dipeptidase [Bombilactobacillus folatiphilus]|uniref:Dipeptidase n=1 Tax=Bombilactobacillus folatiphilus TaxID=2923362 RepID=A0ABY4PA75_9LACO|nr:C69 family dipeptidase [Bombilactobacillus folatiphilus]UQS82529.1 C69 family dipeptidase [Bombilactobacillus folatiphilus]
MDLVQRTSACTSILVGKKASIDGSIIIGRNEDASAALAKHYVVHERREFSKIQHFVSQANHFQMKLPKVRFKYTATPECTAQKGLFEENGFNEYGVAMSATESTYTNATALGADPLVTNGIGEEAMVTCVLPYVQSARAGIERLGSIVEKYGTCESNGVLFADRQEAWYMEIVCGHQWAAQRIPDDSYAVIANQVAIQEIDFADNYNFMFKDDLKEFVVDNQLNPNATGFNFRQIFGTQTDFDEHYNTPRVWYGQWQFSKDESIEPTSEQLPFTHRPAHKLSIDDAKNYLASHFEKTPYDVLNEQAHPYRPISLAKTQESHLLQIRPQLAPAIGCVQWLALGVTAQSVYVPFYLGMTQTPNFYQIGDVHYDQKSAYWLYKLAGVLVDSHYHEFGPLLKECQAKVNAQLNARLRQSDREAQEYSNKTMLANYLTQQSAANAKYAAQQYRQLIAELVTRATAMSPLNYQTDLNL